jgi:hypothetical protein
MIDIATEHLLPSGKSPAASLPGQQGRRVHISAVYRWIQAGRTRTYLEVARICGTSYTSIEAQQRSPTSELLPGEIPRPAGRNHEDPAAADRRGHPPS